MTDRIPTRVLDALTGEPVAITDAGMRQVLAIVTRASEDPEAVEARLGRPLDNTRSVTIRDGVAVIPVTGPIFQRANLLTRVSGATSLQDLAADFTAAYEDPAVRAVLFATDSPGGTIHVAECARLVFERDARLRAAARKPVVMHYSGTGGSAAFWFGAACDRIFATETTSVGSVGTVLQAIIPAAAKEGAERQIEFVYSKSPKKRVNLETEEGASQAQTWIDDVGDVFVANVAEFRGVTVDKVLEDFGQGDMLIASKALAAGMIDGIATLEEVISGLAAETQTGYSITPRFAASTNHQEGRIMTTVPTPGAAGEVPAAQLEALRKQIEDEYKAKSADDVKRYEAEAQLRIAAEVDAFRVPLLAKDDLRFNVQSVGAFANLLIVAKSAAAGLATAKIPVAATETAKATEREITLDAKSLGAFVAEQVKILTDVGAKFEVPTEALAPGKQPTTAALTRTDFEAANAGNEAANAKIDAAIRAKIGTDMSKYAATFNELKGQALAIAA